jgi:hypothetical protein
MKVLKLSLVIITLLAMPLLVSAQLGGLLKKAKEKVADAAKKSPTTNPTPNITQQTNSSDVNCDDLRIKGSYTLELNFRRQSYNDKSFGGNDADRFMKNAQTLDYLNLKKTILNKPGVCEDDAYYGGRKRELIEFESKFLKDFNDRGVSGFNQIIDTAYKYSKSKFSTEKPKGIEWIDSAVMLIQAVKMILPNEESVNAIETEVLNAEKGIKGDLAKGQSKITTGPMHLKYIDQIKFSSKPIVLGKENENDFKTSFSANEKIYGVAYFRAGIKDLSGGAGENQEMFATVSADGQFIFGRGSKDQYDMKIGRRITKTDIEQNISAWTFELIADEFTATSDSVWIFAEMMKTISPRKHTIKLQMGDWNKGGSFTIDLSGVDLDKFVEDAKTTAFQAEENIAKNRTLPSDWKQYDKSVFADRALSLPLMKGYLQIGFEALEILKVVVLEYKSNPDWTIVKNEIDVPKFKASSTVGVAYKAKDNKCYFTTANFFRTYEGGGSYGNIQVNRSTNSAYIFRLDCSNVNK